MNVEDPQSADLDHAKYASATSAARFAEQLRALRAQAGNPSYRHLARVMHYSPSTIADATAGRRLPTEPVVRALATACGADPDLWADRLRGAAQAQSGGASAAEAPRGGESSGGAAHAGPDEEVGQSPADPAGGGWWSGKTARWATAGSGAVALLFAGYGVGAATARKAPPKTVVVTVAPKPTYPAFDGADPAAAGCAADEQLLDKAPVMLNGVQVGAVDLKYSVRCGAGWARVYLYPAFAAKLTGTLASVSVVAADGTTMSIAARLDLQVPNYTNVVAPHGGCLRAMAVLGPDTAKPVRAQTACDPPPTPSKH